jgi:hypothetical protein
MPRPWPQPCPLKTTTDDAGLVVTVAVEEVEELVDGGPGEAARSEEARPPRISSPAEARARA